MNTWKRIVRWFRPRSYVQEATRQHDAAYLRFMLDMKQQQHFLAEMAQEQRKKNNEHH